MEVEESGKIRRRRHEYTCCYALLTKHLAGKGPAHNIYQVTAPSIMERVPFRGTRKKVKVDPGWLHRP
jgi:hypothetical protein